MKDLRISTLLILFAFVASLTLLAGCGEDVEAGDGDSDSSSDVDVDSDNDSDSDADGDNGVDECDEGFELNPFTGQCVETVIDDDGDDDDGDSDGGNGDDGDDDDGDGDSTSPQCGVGQILGQACATNEAALPSAQVNLIGLDCDGNPFEMDTVTDGNGLFSFDNVPSGRHEILVSSGSFFSEERIDVNPGVTTDLTSDSTKLCVSGDVNIMIINGSFDNVPAILDGLDLDYDVITTGADASYFFSDPTELAQYDIIFIECAFTPSSLTGDLTLMMNNLRSWVESGKSLYVSDFSHPFVSQTFPNIATFPTTFPSQSATADVVSTPMQTLLNANTIDILFNTVFYRIDNVTPEAVVHFRGPLVASGGAVTPDVPMMISYTEPINGGTVLFMSFHNRPESLGPDMAAVFDFMIFQL